MTAAVLSTKDAVRVTSLSRTTLWRMVKAGAFPTPVRLSPGRVGFREADVAAWIAGREAA
jgi:prophage regulatory protein